MDLHIALISTALAALINIWLALRILRMRIAGKVIHGDGGDLALARRMRAQANFIEYTPIFLILVLVLQLYGRSGWVLGLSALAFLMGRVVHAIGMDLDRTNAARMVGMIVTFTVLVALALAALLAAFRLI